MEAGPPGGARPRYGFRKDCGASGRRVPGSSLPLGDNAATDAVRPARDIYRPVFSSLTAPRGLHTPLKAPPPRRPEADRSPTWQDFACARPAEALCRGKISGRQAGAFPRSHGPRRPSCRGGGWRPPRAVRRVVRRRREYCQPRRPPLGASPRRRSRRPAGPPRRRLRDAADLLSRSLRSCEDHMHALIGPRCEFVLSVHLPAAGTVRITFPRLIILCAQKWPQPEGHLRQRTSSSLTGPRSGTGCGAVLRVPRRDRKRTTSEGRAPARQVRRAVMPSDATSTRVVASAVRETRGWACDCDCGRARGARGVRASAGWAGRVFTFVLVGSSGNSDQRRSGPLAGCFGGRVPWPRPPVSPVACGGASIATQTSVTMPTRAGSGKRRLLTDAERNAAVPFRNPSGRIRHHSTCAQCHDLARGNRGPRVRRPRARSKSDGSDPVALGPLVNWRFDYRLVCLILGELWRPFMYIDRGTDVVLPCSGDKRCRRDGFVAVGSTPRRAAVRAASAASA